VNSEFVSSLCSRLLTVYLLVDVRALCCSFNLYFMKSKARCLPARFEMLKRGMKEHNDLMGELLC
jgi:hypothetical protein